MHKILSLLGWLILCFTAAWLGNEATTPAIPTWYAGLAKPSFNPPNWIFGPVWTVLYILMAVSAWRVQYAPSRAGATLAWWVFGVQLALNALWSWLFFHWHLLGWACVEITLLLAAIGAMIVVFTLYDRVAGWLQLPYAAWVSFATLLNFTLWRLNG